MAVNISLPFWMAKGELDKLRLSAEAWWAQVLEWAAWPVRQLDTDTCDELVLDMVAWQRDIARFDGEPLSLYRKRIKYAYANARDAGSVAGFKRIFQRLGIGYVEIEERMPGIDWDIVDIQLTDSQLAENQALLTVLIQHYGRTCRRYRWKIITPLPVSMRVVEFGNEYVAELAKVPPCMIRVGSVDFGNDYATL
ncbi:phage tail protein [Desulfovibrio psychrotolerans]|uniref:Phage tail protein n=1 Tax=Desulfovibrio psychrotolerans TaxID=415242 RepID=A0A7J0BXK2_9BACT|nr:phage tail protein [Desulfovibrio psychrotolerans]GFM37724.1 phage tail protein [Desulfovibrio psychrotolerans]